MVCFAQLNFLGFFGFGLIEKWITRFRNSRELCEEDTCVRIMTWKQLIVPCCTFITMRGIQKRGDLFQAKA